MLIVGRNATTIRAALRPLRPSQFLINPVNCLNSTNGINKIAKPVASLRRFHASPPKQFDVLDICMSQAHQVFTSVHSFTGLPWVLALPLTAFLVRLCLITPFNIYGQQTLRRRVALQPLLYAWARPLAVRVATEHGTQSEAYRQKMLKKGLHYKQRELYRKFGIKQWPIFAPLINFPVWLVFMETIRRMCGTHEGLLGLIAKAFKQSEDETEVALTPVEAGASSAYIEPSMAFEGALWFPDLLVPDPMLILPFALSACFFATIVQQDRRILNRFGVLTKWQTRRSRISKLVVLAIGPLTLHLPSAMLVYWMASSLTVLGQNILLDTILPIPTVAVPTDFKRRHSGN
ncbi:hypothetical protein MMC11_006705 [Xylographa trunciseda]|nr:hypothetical protein [Xylographa trunciseda]